MASGEFTDRWLGYTVLVALFTTVAATAHEALVFPDLIGLDRFFLFLFTYLLVATLPVVIVTLVLTIPLAVGTFRRLIDGSTACFKVVWVSCSILSVIGFVVAHVLAVTFSRTGSRLSVPGENGILTTSAIVEYASLPTVFFSTLFCWLLFFRSPKIVFDKGSK